MAAVAQRFEINIDTTALKGLDDKLKVLDSAALRELRTSAVDIVSLSVRKAATSETVKQLNLTRDYVEARIERDEAKARGNTALAVVRSQVRGATLQRFGAERGERPVTWSNSRILGMGKEFGKWPGWTERKGDASRNIAPDFKSDGVWVDVNRKGDRQIASAFTMPLRNNNGLGVFRRTNGKVEHLYGPSVYQTFRRHVQEKERDIQAELTDNFLAGLDSRLAQL